MRLLWYILTAGVIDRRAMSRKHVHLNTTNWQQELDQSIDSHFDEMVRLRRHLHQHPELSGDEQNTSLHLYQLLSDRGFAVRMGPDGRGVVADIPDPSVPDAPSPAENGPAQRGPAQQGPAQKDTVRRIAIRADIDALPIQDEKDVEYRSQREGIMHACGHDAHTAITFGAICSLKRLGDKGLLPGPMRLRGIFQPAEEICRGAQEMIDVGAIDDVDAIIALHMDPTRDLGHVGIRIGVLTAHCDAIEIVITGRGGHAARPHETIDPIAAAAQLIHALYLHIPRVTDSQDAVVVTIGQITAGEHGNVIPERVELRGTVRTLSKEVRDETMLHIRRMAEGVAITTDTTIEVDSDVGTQAVVNDEGVTRIMLQSAKEVIGNKGIDLIGRPSMGSEDFAFYSNRIPGSMMRLGCTSPRVGGMPLHSPTFDFDEQSLLLGARILARTAIHWSQANNIQSTGEQARGKI